MSAPRMRPWLGRIGLVLLATGVRCNLYEGRTLELFPEAEVAGRACVSAADCPRDRAFCAAGACLECLVDADCGRARPACVGNVCVECDSADDCAPQQGCNAVLDVCAAACAVPSDCAGQPDARCSSELGVCVRCLADVDCTDPRNPACDLGGRCVECLSDAHCPAAKPSCEVATRRCVACVRAADCDDGRVCDTRDSRCVDCLGDADCEGGTCDLERRRCQVPCAGPLGCAGRRPVCDEASGSCVECTTDAACLEPARPACNLEQRCVECLSDEHCRMPGKPACIAATQRCGECSRDEHCPMLMRCDLQAARCAAALPVGPLAPPPPGP